MATLAIISSGRSRLSWRILFSALSVAPEIARYVLSHERRTAPRPSSNSSSSFCWGAAAVRMVSASALCGHGIGSIFCGEAGNDEAGSAIGPSKDTFISAIWMSGKAGRLAKKGIFRIKNRPALASGCTGQCLGI
jgi:hypothetical protein